MIKDFRTRNEIVITIAKPREFLARPAGRRGPILPGREFGRFASRRRGESDEDPPGGGGPPPGFTAPPPIISLSRHNRTIRLSYEYTDVNYYFIVRGTPGIITESNGFRQIQFTDRNGQFPSEDPDTLLGMPMIFPYNQPYYEWPAGRLETYDIYGYSEWANWAGFDFGTGGTEPNVSRGMRVRDLWTVGTYAQWSPWAGTTVSFLASSPA